MKFEINYAKGMKGPVFLLLTIGLAVVNVYSVTYPDMPYSGPISMPVFPSKFATFTPPVTNAAPNSLAPTIAEWTRSNGPGDTMALTGEQLSLHADEAEGRDASFMAYGEGALPVVCLIQRLAGRQSALTLPASLPDDEMYLMWPHNEYGFGEPIAINQTEAWWIGSDRVTTHETFSIYGRNLALGSTNSYAYCVEQDQWLTNAVACNPYRVEFAVPENWPNGTYTIYAHNGHGRQYGWSKGLTLTVFNRHDWNAGTIYNVTDAPYNATGDGSTDDYAAIASALDAAGSGDTVYFPEGTYLISEDLYNNLNNTRVLGDGMGSSIIKAHPSLTDPALVNKGIDNSLIQDISFASNVRTENDDMILMRIGGTENTVFRNVRFDQRADVEFLGSLMEGGGMHHTTFSNCEFYASGNLYLGDASGRQVFFADCDFYGLNDNNTLISANGREYCFSGCTLKNYDDSDAVEGYGWCKGRWISGQGKTWGGPKYWYFGDNTTSNLCPRRPAVRFSLSATAFGANTATFSDLSSLPEINGLRLDIVTGARAGNWAIVTSADKATGVVTISKDWTYFGGPPSTSDTLTLKDYVDANSGEAVMTESMPAVYRGNPVSATSDTVTFSGLSTDYSRHSMTIVSGRGQGQTREIESFSSGTVTLGESWRVVPDANSVLIIGEGFHGLVAYGNYFDGTENSIDPDWDSASTGVEPYGMVSDWIVDGNTFESLRQGIAEYGMVESMDGIHTAQPLYFCTYKNNIITNCYEGITRELVFSTSASSYNIDPLVVGSIFRENKIMDCFSAIRCDLSNTSRAEDFVYLSVYDRNTSSDCDQFFIGRSGMLNQVWIGNAFFSSNGGAGISGWNRTFVLRGNIWSGFSSNYAGDNLEGILELPVRIDNLGGTISEKSLPIWNSGAALLDWTATTTSSWLRLTKSSGSVSDENNQDVLSFELESGAAPAVGSQAVITVTGGGQAKQITVTVSELGGVEGLGTVTIPLEFNSDSRVRARLVDLGTSEELKSGQFRDLGELNSTEELVLSELEDHAYLVIYEVYDDILGVWVAADITNKFNRQRR